MDGWDHPIEWEAVELITARRVAQGYIRTCHKQHIGTIQRIFGIDQYPEFVAISCRFNRGIGIQFDKEKQWKHSIS